jgi:hypothetical protein
MTDHNLIMTLIIAGGIVEALILGLIIWMVRDVHKSATAQYEHLQALEAANFIQGRQVKAIVDEARRLLQGNRRSDYPGG